MKKQAKIIALAILLATGISLTGFASGRNAANLADVQRGVARLSEEMALSLPFNSSFGLNWSDAYIGKQEKGFPFVFGVGLTLGFSTLTYGAIDNLVYQAGVYGLDIDRFFFPAYTADLRLGGFSLPFDIGFKAGFLPPIEISSIETKINYTLLGADIRYAILQGNGTLPKISIGVGLNYLDVGAIGRDEENQTINYGTGSFRTMGPRDVSLQMEAITLDTKAQISKSFNYITPCFGLGVNHGWTKAGFSIVSALQNLDGLPLSENEIAAIGRYGVSVNSRGISSMLNNTSLGFRAFGGLSFDLPSLRIDLTGLYNFRDSNFGISLGFRYQSSGR